MLSLKGYLQVIDNVLFLANCTFVNFHALVKIVQSHSQWEMIPCAIRVGPIFMFIGSKRVSSFHAMFDQGNSDFQFSVQLRAPVKTHPLFLKSLHKVLHLKMVTSSFWLILLQISCQINSGSSVETLQHEPHN